MRCPSVGSLLEAQQELHLSLSLGCQGSKHAGRHLSLPRHTWGVELEAESGLNFKHFDMGCGSPKWVLTLLNHDACFDFLGLAFIFYIPVPRLIQVLSTSFSS